MQTAQAVTEKTNSTELETIYSVLSNHNVRLKEITNSFEDVGNKLRNNSDGMKAEQNLPPKSEGMLDEIKIQLDAVLVTTNRLESLYTKFRSLV